MYQISVTTNSKVGLKKKEMNLEVTSIELLLNESNYYFILIYLTLGYQTLFHDISFWMDMILLRPPPLPFFFGQEGIVAYKLISQSSSYIVRTMT